MGEFSRTSYTQCHRFFSFSNLVCATKEWFRRPVSKEHGKHKKPKISECKTKWRLQYNITYTQCSPCDAWRGNTETSQTVNEVNTPGGKGTTDIIRNTCVQNPSYKSPSPFKNKNMKILFWYSLNKYVFWQLNRLKRPSARHFIK